jgi:hypothetical protein
MFKRRQIVPGEAPGVLKLSGDASAELPVITLIEYRPDCPEERRDIGCEELLPHPNNELVTWIATATIIPCS